MLPTSAIALFCSDIRDEKSDTTTLVGVLPDNITFVVPDNAPPGATGALPKLCIYIRVHFDPQNELGPINAKLIFPDNTERAIEVTADQTVENARVESLRRGHPVAAFFTRVEIAPFPVMPGRLLVEMTIGAETYICGALNFHQSSEVK